MKLRIDKIKNQRGATATLLRTSWREGMRIRHKTIANLSKLPQEVVDGISILLRGGTAFDPATTDGVSIRRSLPHGHAAAALGTARRIGLERILHRSRSRKRDLALAAIAARIIAPDSKLATARRLSPETADSSLGSMLGLGQVSGNEMLDMLDWLRQRQPWIEKSLANRHLGNGTLILYDVSSSYVEGRCCPLAAFGHNRDGKKGKKQITFGLLCATDGCPVAVEVFSGNTADPSTVALQIAKLRSRFGITRLALVGDRGMITTARIREDLEPAGLDWISALRNADIRRLLRPCILECQAGSQPGSRKGCGIVLQSHEFLADSCPVDSNGSSTNKQPGNFLDNDHFGTISGICGGSVTFRSGLRCRGRERASGS